MSLVKLFKLGYVANRLGHLQCDCNPFQTSAPYLYEDIHIQTFLQSNLTDKPGNLVVFLFVIINKSHEKKTKTNNVLARFSTLSNSVPYLWHSARSLFDLLKDVYHPKRLSSFLKLLGHIFITVFYQRLLKQEQIVYFVGTILSGGLYTRQQESVRGIDSS